MSLADANATLDHLAAAGSAAALGAAFELGLFPLLEQGPAGVGAIASALALPERRCRYWLQLLAGTGLFELAEDRYALSPAGRRIFGAYSDSTWRFLARSAREMQPLFADLPARLAAPAARWRGGIPLPPDYVQRMRNEPGYCEQFTRMLMELHAPLAESLAARLPLDGARRLLDLGGGSGVMSHALLRAHPGLEAVVVDIPPVCALGERLAAEAGLSDRLRFAPVADFTVDPLPDACDLVLECDLSVHTEPLFRRLHASLPSGGRLALVDQFAPAMGVAPPERVLWRFEGALLDNDFETPTADAVGGQLERAGFRLVKEERLETVWTLLLVERD